MLDFLSALSQPLSSLWEMSVTAAYAAVVVIVLRLLLKKRAPRQVICLLWLVVFTRLLIPVSLESPISIVPDAFPGQTQAQLPDSAGQPASGQTQPPAQTAGGIPALSVPGANTPAPALPDSTAPAAPPQALDGGLSWRAVLAGIWLTGALAMGGWGLASYLRLRRRLYDAIRAPDGAWEHPSAASPFILGLFRPKIFLPTGLNGQPRQFILCHERAHLRRFDHIVKPVCWAALALHWFNPLVWAAYLLMSRDIEAACDEAVIRQLGPQVKADYSAALLSLATRGRVPAPCPLAFDEGNARGRIKNVLNYRRPALWIIVVSVIAAALAAVCLLTDPMSDREPTPSEPLPAQSGGPFPTPSPAPDTSLNALLDPWMKEVLDGERSFTPVRDYGDNSRTYTIHDLRTFYYGDDQFPDARVELGELAIIDLDKDGLNELVVWPEGDDEYLYSVVGYLILRRQGDTVYAYNPVYRAFGLLKADGTFNWSSSAFNSGTGSALFTENGFEVKDITWCEIHSETDERYFVDGQEATKWDFESAMTAQRQKDEPVWYVYENGALSRILPTIPLEEAAQAAPVPDFLDEEQQLLYRQAYALYYSLFPASNEFQHFLPAQGVVEPAEGVERHGVTYAPEYGRFNRWDDFERAVLSVFTQDAWDAKNGPHATGGAPVYIGVDGRTYYIPYGRSGGDYNGYFPETFRLVSRTDDAIEFVMTGYYTNWGELPGETFEEWQARQEEWEYAIDFPMRLVKTADGWRFDQFHLAITDDFGTPGLPRIPNPDRPMDITTAAPLNAPVLDPGDTLPENPQEWYKVAELPDDMIWVYSRNWGAETLIRWDGNFYKAFHHVAHTPHLEMPQLKKLGGGDAYGPLAVISEVNSGSAVFGQGLVVYDLDGSDPMDYAHDWTPLAEEFNRAFSYQYDSGTRTLTLSCQGQTVTKALTEDLRIGDEVTALSITGDQVHYSFDETEDDCFRLRLGVHVFVDGNVTNLFPVSASWTIRFNGGGFDTVPGSFTLS